VILGLPTAESLQVRWGQLLVNLYINPKLIFVTLSPSIELNSVVQTHATFDPGLPKKIINNSQPNSVPIIKKTICKAYLKRFFNCISKTSLGSDLIFSTNIQRLD